MKPVEDKERFIELRASGLSYDAIAEQMNVSKPTLITWSRLLSKELSNARSARMDELFERFAVSKSKRVELFGGIMNGILAELSKRDLKEVSTEGLIKLALRYGAAMRDEHEPLLMQGFEEIGEWQIKQTKAWPA